MNRWKILVALIGVSLLSMSVQAAPSKEVVWPAGAIKWEPGPLPGVHVAKLWGDWMKGGPYGVLVKFNAGIMNPLHKHTQTLKIVVVSGTFVHQPKGGTETKLGPGSYLLQAAGQWHVSGCAGRGSCWSRSWWFGRAWGGRRGEGKEGEDGSWRMEDGRR